MNIKLKENPKLFALYIQLLEIKIKAIQDFVFVQCRKDDMQFTLKVCMEMCYRVQLEFAMFIRVGI